MNIRELRQARLRELLTNAGTQVALSKQIGKAPAQISQWLNGTRTMEEETASEIAAYAKLANGWLDTVPRALHPYTVAPSHVANIIARDPAPVGEPPAPDFTKPSVSASEWATLQDIAVLPHDEQLKLRAELKERADKYRAYVSQVLAKQRNSREPQK